MENNPSYSCIESQKCIYCAEKDQMLKKYQKLVQLLKKRVKRCSAISVNTFQFGSSQIGVTQLTQQLLSSRNSANSSLAQQEETKQSSNDTAQNVVQNIVQKYKIKEEQHKPRKSVPELFSLTSPSVFNRIHTDTTSKKISLCSQWQQRFNKLSEALDKKQQRIENLTDQIFCIKNEQLYIREIMKNLLKSLSIKDPSHIPHKLTITNKSKDIIKLLLHIFEYSEQEMQIICGGDCENASKSNNRPKSERKVSHDQENNKASKIDYRDVCVPHKINGIKIQQIR